MRNHDTIGQLSALTGHSKTEVTRPLKLVKTKLPKYIRLMKDENVKDERSLRQYK